MSDHSELWEGEIFMSSLQRIIWFHNKIINKSYPNASDIAKNFEISVRQSQRDIEYMRDSINAPLVYCSRHRGYYYEHEFILPSFFLSEYEKNILWTLVEQNRKIGEFGYFKYRDQAKILGKIIDTKSSNNAYKEPYIAELQMIGARKSTVSLDYFLCQKGEANRYTYAFFDPDIFLSVLIASNLSFKIISPQWLKDYMKEKLNELLLNL